METIENLEIILQEKFPFFREQPLREEFCEKAKLMEIPEGTIIMDIGSYIHVIPLVISGSIKVIREDGDGNELLLYYLSEAETCAMTLSCCMRQEMSGIRAIAEDDVILLAIPYEIMDSWMRNYPSWKEFVMLTFQLRFDELLRTIDSIAFKKMDERLLQFLKDKSALKSHSILNITHQEIAYDLNTSREVISRLLKELERMKLIKLSRNQVELL